LLALILTEFPTALAAGAAPSQITTGPDGNLWFTENANGGRIGRITPAGTITEFTNGLTADSGPEAIAAGPDGNLWFTENNDPGRIGRITPGPGALTGAASGVGTSAATLNGSVRPNSQLTTFQFQYGTDTSYGSETPAQLAGQDASEHPVSAALAGLTPGTTYHYRLVATNPSDTTFGADRTFTTALGLGLPAGPGPPAKASFAGSRSSITVDRKGRFSFSFHAGPGLKGGAVFASVGKVRVSRRQKVTLAHKSFTVPASGNVTLRIKLSKKNFKILKLDHKISAGVTITLTNSAGLASTASKRLTLKAPKQRGH
jgi:hypothetical protein